jgi:hypothetical protein
VVIVRGDLALIVTAGLVVVRRTTWPSPSSTSITKVVSGDQHGQGSSGVGAADADALAQTETTPVGSAMRCTLTGSWAGRGGGPASRAPRRDVRLRVA